MFSLQRFLSSGDKFYDLLESSAKEVHLCASIVSKMLSNGTPSEHLEALGQLRKRHKEITWKITEELCNTFATPIEREDIESIVASLYKIPKALTKFADGVVIGIHKDFIPYFTQQAELLQQAVEILYKMIQDLHKSPNPTKVRKMNDEIHSLEAEADERMAKITRELYSGQYDPITVIFIKEINDLMEKGIDRCRNTGNILFTVALKYS